MQAILSARSCLTTQERPHNSVGVGNCRQMHKDIPYPLLHGLIFCHTPVQLLRLAVKNQDVDVRGTDQPAKDSQRPFVP
jgi:hypothetical protein